MGARPAATFLFLAALLGGPMARAQQAPKAMPTTPVEASHLSAPSDPFPGAAWTVREPPPAIDKARLLVAADAAFADPPPAELPGTRALIVVYRGAIVYERYAEGFSERSLFPSGSMGEMLVSAGAAILAAEDKFAGGEGGGAADARALARGIAPHARDRLQRRAAIRRFYDEKLFLPLAVTSAVLAFDRGGQIDGGAFAHMTGRDYARLGYLYLRDGEWNGRRILPAPWAGLRRTLPGDPLSRLAAGDGGQAILVAPARNLVIVRLGRSPAAAWPAIEAFLGAIAAMFQPG